jgi:hypothetical protein
MALAQVCRLRRRWWVSRDEEGSRRRLHVRRCLRELQLQ